MPTGQCPLQQIVFLLHVLLVFVLWGSIAMQSAPIECQDLAPRELALDKTVKHLLAMNLACVTDLPACLPPIAPTTDLHVGCPERTRARRNPSSANLQTHAVRESQGLGWMPPMLCSAGARRHQYTVVTMLDFAVECLND